jgi:hypothetical protein
VSQVIKLAGSAKRAILVIPLMPGVEYANKALEAGGELLYWAEAGTWSYVPSKYWKGIGKQHGGYLPYKIGVILFQSENDKASEWDKDILAETIHFWWAAQVPETCTENATKLRNECRNEEYGWDWPDQLRWWDGKRPMTIGWGAGRDARGTGGAWARCGSWDPGLGAMGYVPPGLKHVLKGLGATSEAAKVAVSAMEKTAEKAYHVIWKARCKAQKKKEEAVGISTEAKMDKQTAAAWRREASAKAKEIREADMADTDEEEQQEEEDDWMHDDTERDGKEGSVVRDNMGRVTVKYCKNRHCARAHTARTRECKSCGDKLPSGARKGWTANKVNEIARGSDDFWRTVADQGHRARDPVWKRMGWGGGSPCGGLYGKGVKRRREAGRGRGSLLAETERAGGRAGVRGARKRRAGLRRGLDSAFNSSGEEDETNEEELEGRRGVKRKKGEDGDSTSESEEDSDEEDAW